MAVRISRSRLPILGVWPIKLLRPLLTISCVESSATRLHLNFRKHGYRCQYWHSANLSASRANWDAESLSLPSHLQRNWPAIPSIVPFSNQGITREFRCKVAIPNSLYVLDKETKHLMPPEFAARDEYFQRTLTSRADARKGTPMFGPLVTRSKWRSGETPAEKTNRKTKVTSDSPFGTTKPDCRRRAYFPRRYVCMKSTVV